MAIPSNARRAKFGDYVADFAIFELRKHGIRVRLQDQPFQILKLLLQCPGQLVTREELRSELWKESTFVDFDAGLNAAMRRLRDALNDSADKPRYIETLPRHGYRFIAPVEILAESVPAVRRDVPAASGNNQAQPDVAVVAKRDNPPVGNQPENWRAPWFRRLAAACVLVVTFAMAALVLRSRVYGKRLDDGRPYSLAVLPLENLSGDHSQDYFADGMTDALITDLAQSSSLHVISSTSSMRYRGAQKPVPEIGRELNVSLIVEGSVIRSGNHVRISAQLVDAAKDQHLWAGRYDRDLQDILQLQSDLAAAVTRELVGNLTPKEQAGFAAEARPVNPQALDAYLRGHSILNQWTVAGFEKGRDYFQQAINLDPSYAAAWGGLAEYYGTVAFMSVAPPREAWFEAEKLLAKTLEMDGKSSRAHALLGMINLQFHCDAPAAEKELNLALDLNPADMSALDFHSYYLLEMGRNDEAIAEKQTVLAHDPVAVRINAEMGLYFLTAGHVDEAIRQLQKTLELDPNYAAAHMRLGLAYEKKQQYPEALVEFQKAISLDRKPARLWHLGELYALWGKRREARQTIKELQQMSKNHYTAPTMIALVYARLGEKRAALDWLEKANPDDDPKISDSGFDSLRSEPSFKALEPGLKPNPACPAF